jgi:general secretion pathway protein I
MLPLHCRKQSAFTLVEVLIAVAIVSIALLAALRAAGLGTNNVDELRSRLLAGWVAENVMARHRARADWPPPGIQRGTERQADREFVWREEVTATPSSGFRRVDVYVYAGAEGPSSLAHLTGFVGQPRGSIR